MLSWVVFTALLVTFWNIPIDSITFNSPFSFVGSDIVLIFMFFLYFIASWIGLVLGIFRTGSPSFTWGVVFLLVSHLFGFQFPLPDITWPTNHPRFGAFAATMIQFIPPHSDFNSHYIPRLIKIYVFWWKKKKKEKKNNEYWNDLKSWHTQRLSQKPFFTGNVCIHLKTFMDSISK